MVHYHCQWMFRLEIWKGVIRESTWELRGNERRDLGRVRLLARSSLVKN